MKFNNISNLAYHLIIKGAIEKKLLQIVVDVCVKW